MFFSIYFRFKFDIKIKRYIVNCVSSLYIDICVYIYISLWIQTLSEKVLNPSIILQTLPKKVLGSMGKDINVYPM